MNAALLLVRHTEVARAWRGRCYGASDMGLSRAGAAHARQIAPGIAAWRPDLVIHSGLRRTRYLAGLVARLANVDAIAEPRWRERDFGDWEGRTWLSIYRATGNAMDGMIDAPDVFRPGGGETTTELADRIEGAYRNLPAGRIVLVTHGGAIAAFRGQQEGKHISEWPKIVPALGAAWETYSLHLDSKPSRK